MAVRARIEKDITKHTLSICHLRSELNTLSPIYRLPPELLATIFIGCASDYHNNTKDFHFTRIVPTWVNVSYVCRYWRGVALDCTTLWTYHFVISPRWTEELLVRSKQALLKTSCNLVQYDSGRIYFLRRLIAVDHLMAQTERIQELRMALPNIDSDQILRLFSSRAPCLQTLDLKLWVADSSKQYPVVVLFQGDTPALRALELEYCPVPWYLLNLSGLTTLSLRHVPICFQQKTEEFLATLGDMHDLTHLELDAALACADDFLRSPAFHSRQKINLPHLSRLLIDAPLSTVIALLSCVNIPFKTELRLTCRFEDAFPDNFTLLSPVLAQWFNTSLEARSAIRSLVIHFSWRGWELTFSGLERDCDPSYFDSESGRSWGYNTPLRIFLACTVETTNLNHCWINEFCSSLPLMHVQSLHAINPPTSSMFWMETLGHLQDLRSSN
ncbi:hypothetical protein OG21DRAFT_1443243 [Imleria badia]|nr:hypothetical protein OG21DRAFT_1443243 [Imleria badia]